MERCTYCGGEYKHVKNGRYCSKECFKLSRSMVLNLTPPSIYKFAEKFSENDRFFFVEFPLKMYNKHFKRDITVENFIESLKKISSEKKLTDLGVYLFTAYYISSKNDCKDFIDFRTALTVLSPVYKNSDVKTKYLFDYKGSCKAKNRVNAYFKRALKKLLEKQLINENDDKKIRELYEKLRFEDMGFQNVSSALVIAYILANFVGASISQNVFSDALGISQPTLRNNSYAILERLKNERKIIFDDNGTVFGTVKYRFKSLGSTMKVIAE